jgi:hypothetical protein
LNMSLALELFNKTNQFNTTGQRYTLEQCHQFFSEGNELHVIQAEDRFTQYGLIGAAWVHENCVKHVVMSCRALGLGIEDTFLASIANRLVRQNVREIIGLLQPTEANTACRPFYGRNGFTQVPAYPLVWRRPLTSYFATPPHVSLTVSDLANGEPVAIGKGEGHLGRNQQNLALKAGGTR